MTSVDVLFLIVYLFITGSYFLLPYLSFATLPFGVRIPLAYAHHPAIITERRRYMLLLGMVTGAILAAAIVLRLFMPWPPLRPLSFIALVIGCWGVYYLSHQRLVRVKASEQWFANTRQAVMAHVTPPIRVPARIFWLFLALPCAVTVLTAALGVWCYASLPSILHFRLIHSFGDWTLTKTPVHAFLPVIFQVVFTLILGGGAWLGSFIRQQIDVEDPVGSQQQQHLTRQIIQLLLLLLALGFAISFLLTALIGWNLLMVSANLLPLAMVAPLGVWMIVAPVLLLGLRSHQHVPVTSGPYVNRDDDRFWKLGVFYVNRDNPALFIARRFSIGWTLNFGNPFAWGIALAIVAVIIVNIVLKTR